ncbi:MAG TPA: GDSL-type esterase/lipase family protein [Planctomicrobium sp.]|nr:GDSL-type esterase/lipase family protein [Planctomicrobium sp.]
MTTARMRWSPLLGLLLFGAIHCWSIPVARAEEPAPTHERWEPNIRKFEEADKESPPKSGQVVFVGSSSIVRWNLPESFPGLDALNRGFGGSNLSDTVHFFERAVTPYRPRTIVVYAGDNDLAKGYSSGYVIEQFRQLLKKRAEQLPESRLVFIGIKPSIKRWNLIEKIRNTNAEIKRICEQMPLTVYVDVDAPAIGEGGKPKGEYLASDGLHLSPEGYQLWNDLVRPYVTGDARLKVKRGTYDAFHPWTPPETLAEWEVEQERIRRQLQVACGLWPLPEKTDLNPVVHSRMDRGDYTIEKVYFSSFPGMYVSGELYRPRKIEGKIPAVLCPHGHFNDGRFHDSGPGAAAGELKSGAEKYLSGAHHPLQARAVQLARMGTIVFFYDMIGYADQGPLNHRGGMDNAAASLWLHNFLGLHTWNSIRALDFVTSLPEVDSTRIGVTGASGGGTQTMLVCAIDPRPTVSFPAVMVSTGMQGGCICENSDYLRIGINNIAIAAVFAPRAQAMSGANDWTIQIETLGLPELKKVYGLYGASDLVTARAFPQFQHNYNQVAREMMYDWFNVHLKLDLPSPVSQTDFWPLAKAQQSVFTDQHPRPADALDEDGVQKQLQERDRKWIDALSSGPADAFQNVIRPAIDIMLPPARGEQAIVNVSDRAVAEGVTRNDVMIHSGETYVPVTLLQPAAKSNKVVLWLDSAGCSHLFTENQAPESAVLALLNKGYAVASADLLLTGSTANGPNPFAAKLSAPENWHKPKIPGDTYTAFLNGYNLPLISERVVDIDRVLRFLQSRDFKEIQLVGTGEAGLWALLARSRWTPDAVSGTVVDLNGFRFDSISTPQDPNLLPGVMKYGGVGGLAAIAFPAPLTIAGAGNLDDSELAPLRKIYGDNPGLKFHSDSQSRQAIVNLISAVN